MDDVMLNCKLQAEDYVRLYEEKKITYELMCEWISGLATLILEEYGA